MKTNDVDILKQLFDSILTTSPTRTTTITTLASPTFSPYISPKFAVIIVDSVCNLISSSSITSRDKYNIISHFVNLCKIGSFTNMYKLSSSLLSSLSSSPFDDNNNNNNNNKILQSFASSFNNLINIIKSFENTKDFGLSLISKGFQTELNGLIFLLFHYCNYFEFLLIQFIQLKKIHYFLKQHLNYLKR
jgi:hypothetical protein